MVNKPNENVLEKLKHEVEAIHNFRPKYIFLTETSSIPTGYVLKEAYKKAYPEEEQPTFYRIDPRAIHSADKKKTSKFYRDRIKDRDAKILVYDENTIWGDSSAEIAHSLMFPEKFGLDENIRCHNVRISAIDPSRESKNNIANKEEYNLPSNIKIWAKGVHGVALTGRGTESGNPHLTYRKKNESEELRGKVARKKDYLNEPGYEKSTPLRELREYKAIGDQVGSKIYEETKKKRSLEHKVTSVIAIASLASSLLFLSSNVTGNAITDLSQNSFNFIGVGLFAIGLIAGFFWLRNRK